MKSVDKQGKNNSKKMLGGITGKGFMPGQSGNPNGRPKSITLSEAYRKQLAQLVPGDPQGRTYAEVIAANVVVSAACGDVGAAREIADRCEGKPKQSLDVDMQVHDWRQLAADYGVSEADVIREARRLIESVDDSSDSASD